MSTEIVLIIIMILLFPLQFILLAIFRSSHEKNLELWTQKEGVKILSSAVVDRSRTPFSWLTTNYSFMFYRVRVLTGENREKSGYLCVAGRLSPLFSKKVRAEWDDSNAPL